MPALHDISVLSLAASILWLTALLAGELTSPRPGYDIRRWSTVFPVGMYAVSSFQVARATQLSLLDSFATTCTWVSVATWLIVTAGMLRKSWPRF